MMARVAFVGKYVMITCSCSRKSLKSLKCHDHVLMLLEESHDMFRMLLMRIMILMGLIIFVFFTLWLKVLFGVLHIGAHIAGQGFICTTTWNPTNAQSWAKWSWRSNARTTRCIRSYDNRWLYHRSPPLLVDLNPLFLRSYVLIRCFVLWYSMSWKSRIFCC